MQFFASLLFLVAAIKPSVTYLLPPTYAASCYYNVGNPCTGTGSIECCTTNGFVYCGPNTGEFAYAPCLSTFPYCHTSGGPPDGIPYCTSFSAPLNDHGIDGFLLNSVDNGGNVIGSSASAPDDVNNLWNIEKDTTGYSGDKR